MNLFWIAGLAAYILLEKTIPMGHWLARIAGIAAMGWGVMMLASAASG
jgi:predicted metal-binding membrane protein